MIKLVDIIEEVKDENLTKEQVDDYYTLACQLKTEISMQLADYLKKEALFMASREGSVAERKVQWNGSTEGQRLIELKTYKLAINSVLDGLKNRIYAKLN